MQTGEQLRHLFALLLTSYIGAAGLLDTVAEPVQGAAFFAGPIHSSKTVSGRRLDIESSGNRSLADPLCPWGKQE